MTMIRSNISGTMAGQFSIGKNGPTIFQGTANPNIANQIGAVGDLYVQLGATPTLYQFRSTSWIDITGEIFSRTAVTQATYAAQPSDFYLGVTVAGANITLPPGTFGKKIIVKDEIGGATGSTPIVIQPNGTDTIDGMGAVVVTQARTALTFVFTNGRWVMLSANPLADSFRQTFTNADLSSGILTVTHGLAIDFPFVQVYDNNRRIIVPDEVISVDPSTVTVKLASYGNISGNWTAAIRK